MKRNSYYLSLLTATAAISACGPAGSRNAGTQKPNIVYILADDLGHGNLGCYGQQMIHTPNLDRMASEGMLFTRHYSGSTVCAPSRSCLLTGSHTGHTYIRDNSEVFPEGQNPLPGEAFTIAEMMKQEGYVTGAFGKWGLGMGDTEGSPMRQGFDQFFGFLCQRHAHRYYHAYLWDNSEKFPLEGNDWTHKVTYAPDVIHARTLDFIRENRDTNFFLFVPSVIPHAELIAPDDSLLNMYKGKFPESPFGLNPRTVHEGNDYGAPDFDIQGYAPQPMPRATFAAMVSRLDHQVGEILDLLNELGIADNTLVIFTSDNGAHIEGGADPDFFNSTGGLRGYKRDLYEGGIRVPMIAWWPGKIKAGTSTDHISAFWDVMPTLAALAGIAAPGNTDGISFLPTLLGQDNQPTHDYLYWEFYPLGGRTAIVQGNWKLVKYNVLKPEQTTTALYNLVDDPAEQHNLAEQHPEKVREMLTKMEEAHVSTEEYSLKLP